MQPRFFRSRQPHGIPTAAVPPFAPVLTTLHIVPPSPIVVPQFTEPEYTLLGFDQVGAPFPVPEDAVGHSSDVFTAQAGLVGVVDGVGYFTVSPQANGTCEIWFTADDVESEHVTVQVTYAVLDHIEVTPDEIEITADDFDTPIQLTAVPRDANDQDTTEPIGSWTSSDPTIATVDETGLVTFTGKSGAANITASIGLIVGTCAVTVALGVADHITITPSSLSLVGEPPDNEGHFVAVVRDAQDNNTGETVGGWVADPTGVVTLVQTNNVVQVKYAASGDTEVVCDFDSGEIYLVSDPVQVSCTPA